MFINKTGLTYLRGSLFFASATLVGLAIIVAGYQDGILDKLEPAALALVFGPFVVIGIASAIASYRGAVVGCCTWLGGFTPVIVLMLIAYLEFHRPRNGGFGGAALDLAMDACLALPGSVVGSLIGLGIGSAISKRLANPTMHTADRTTDILDETGAEP